MKKGTFGVIIYKINGVAFYKQGGMTKCEAFKLAARENDRKTTAFIFEIVEELPNKDRRSGVADRRD